MIQSTNVRVKWDPVNKKHYLHYTNLEGRRRRLSSKTIDPREAERIAMRWEDWLKQGVDPEQEEKRKYQNRRMTLLEFHQQFMQRHGLHLSVNMQQSYHYSWKNLCRCRDIVDRPMANLQQFLVLDYQQARKKLDKVANATVNREICMVKAMLNKAVKWHILDNNPLRGLKQLPEAEKRIVQFSTDEIQCLLAALPVNLKLIVRFAYYTGVRKEEILGLRYRQVHFWDLPKQGLVGQIVLQVKGGRRECLQMDKRIGNIIRKALDNREIREDSYIFINPKTGTRYHKNLATFSRIVRRLNVTADGKFLEFHDFRRNFATQLRQQGTGVDNIQALLHHKNRRTTLGYIGAEPSNLGLLYAKIPSLNEGEEHSWQENGKVTDIHTDDLASKVG
jgi:integrase